MESRLKKSLNAGGRQNRAQQDESRQAPEEKFVSAQERRKMWSDEWTQRALPDVPEIPGWHVCWLSTNNSYDSIDRRVRLGYIPVKTEEVPQYESHKVKSGEHVGFVSCNEMLLYKIPMDVYQEVMKHFHHDMPLDEANKIRIQAEQTMGRDSNGKSLGRLEGEGIGKIDEPLPAPVFSG